MAKDWSFIKTEAEFRLRWAEAVGEGRDPLEAVGRQWGDD